METERLSITIGCYSKCSQALTHYTGVNQWHHRATWREYECLCVCVCVCLYLLTQCYWPRHLFSRYLNLVTQALGRTPLIGPAAQSPPKNNNTKPRNMWTHIHVPSGFQTYEPTAHMVAIIEIYAPFKYVINVSFWSTLVFAIITIIMTSMNQQTESTFICTDIILYCLTDRHNISVTVLHSEASACGYNLTTWYQLHWVEQNCTRMPCHKKQQFDPCHSKFTTTASFSITEAAVTGYTQVLWSSLDFINCMGGYCLNQLLRHCHNWKILLKMRW